MPNQIIEVDGAFGSGGGQILRTAISLSAITKKPCHIFNIRKSRPKPGLATQHLLGIQALAELCQGKLEGDYLGSEEIKFYPGEINRGPTSVNVKIETAGSITLVLQTLIPAALFAPGPIKITFNGGATDTFFSPTIGHFRYVFLKNLEKMLAPSNSEGICSGEGKVEINPHTKRAPTPKFGGEGRGQGVNNAKKNEVSPHCGVGVNILRRGYYPGGGAEVKAIISPTKLKDINLIERGSLKKILVISGASETLKDPAGVVSRPYGAGKKVAERQLAGAREILGKLKLPIEERVEYYQTDCPGSQICLIAEFENTIIGTDNLGKLGKRAEDVGKEAALELLKEERSGACLDKHSADQILPYLALAEKKSEVTAGEITEHCKTNIWVVEKFINGKFEIKDNLISWNPF